MVDFRRAEATIARGYNRLNGRIVSSPLDFDIGAYEPRKQTQLTGYINFLEEQSLILSAFKLDASAKFTFGSGGASAAFSMASSITTQNSSTSLVGFFAIQRQKFDVANPRFNKEALDLLEASQFTAFRDKYGDSFIRTVEAGGSIQIFLQYDLKSYDECVSFKSNANGSFGAFSSSAEFTRMIKKHAENRKISISFVLQDSDPIKFEGIAGESFLDKIMKQIDKIQNSILNSDKSPFALVSHFRDYSEVLNYNGYIDKFDKCLSKMESAGQTLILVESARRSQQLILDFSGSLTVDQVAKAKILEKECARHEEKISTAVDDLQSEPSDQNIEVLGTAIGSAKNFLDQLSSYQMLLEERKIEYRCKSSGQPWSEWEENGARLSRVIEHEMGRLEVKHYEPNLKIAMDIYKFDGRVPGPGFGISHACRVSIVSFEDASLPDNDWEVANNRVAVGLRFRLTGAAAKSYRLRWRFNDGERWYTSGEWSMTGPFDATGKLDPCDRANAIRMKLYKLVAQTETL